MSSVWTSLLSVWSPRSDFVRFAVDYYDSVRFAFLRRHRNAYNMVLHKYGDILYKGLKEAIEFHLREVAERVSSAADSNFLAELNKAWADHKVSMLMIRDILMYMVSGRTLLLITEYEFHMPMHSHLRSLFLFRCYYYYYYYCFPSVVRTPFVLGPCLCPTSKCVECIRSRLGTVPRCGGTRCTHSRSSIEHAARLGATRENRRADSERNIEEYHSDAS